MIDFYTFKMIYIDKVKKAALDLITSRQKISTYWVV